MNLSPEWESLYAAGRPGSIWPWSDLVSYVMRYARPESSDFKVLELGCGGGANIPFFKHLDVGYYGIEGSATMVNTLKQRHPECKDNIVHGDFTTTVPFKEQFDLIVDRASLAHNSTSAIKNCISLISEHLIPGGIFIGIDWFSMAHTDFQYGEFVDENTKHAFSTGQFHQIGKVHFSDRTHILELFKDFTFIKLEHKIIVEEFPESAHQFASWNFAVKKRT